MSSTELTYNPEYPSAYSSAHSSREAPPTLDYNLPYDTQRVEQTRRICQYHDYAAAYAGKLLSDESAAAKNLETLANYILYGKDKEKLTNSVQQKRILPPPSKYASYQRKQAESLEELLEMPGFDEANLRQYNERNTYTHPKPTIRRPQYNKAGEKISDGDAGIPGMVELWDSIDRMERKLKIYQHKIQPQNEEEQAILRWDTVTAYKMKHWLIDLRKQQYYLKESFECPIPSLSSFTHVGKIDWDTDSGYWVPCSPPEGEGKEDNPTLVKYIDENHKDDTDHEYYYNAAGASIRRNIHDDTWETFHLVREHKLDLTNPTHIYHILKLYCDLLKSSYGDPNSQMKHILLTIDELAIKANFTDVQFFILNHKICHWTNDRICAALEKEFGVKYTSNYISTIFSQTICGKIADMAKLQKKEQDNLNNPAAWKKCTCCGRKLLRDTYFFVRKSGTKDGLAARCKDCDKAARNKE